MEHEFIYPLLTMPMTTGMYQLLKKCLESEVRNQPPPYALLPQAAGLIRRGLVLVKPYVNTRGKSIMSIYISERGKEFLTD